MKYFDIINEIEKDLNKEVYDALELLKKERSLQET